MHLRPLLRPLFCLLFLWASIVPAHSSSTMRLPVTPQLQASQSPHQRMAHNFFVIYDPSTAMDVPYKNTGLTRIEAQKKILRGGNASLPELNWQAGLYPHWKGELWLHASPMGFKPYYPLSLYNKVRYGAAIEALPTTPQSPPMLQTGLMKLEHLLGLPGRTEVFLFSNGHHMTEKDLEPEPLVEAKKLAAKYDVCFNIISSAQGAAETRLLNDIAAVNSCSQVIDFDSVYQNPAYLFGKLYKGGYGQAFANILFDFDKSLIRSRHYADLNALGRLMKDNPQLTVALSGFCDSTGTERYNINLSKRRAENVANYLRKNFGIKKDRLLLHWYGYANPVTSNATKEGRQRNRRVTIFLPGMQKGAADSGAANIINEPQLNQLKSRARE